MKNIFTLYVVFLSFYFSACSEKSETITPEVKTITESIYASGVIKSDKQYTVSTKVPGLIEQIFVTEGEFVKKNAPIFKIEDGNAALNAINSKLLALNNDYIINLPKLKDAKNTIELAEKKLTNDSLLLARYETLWQNNNVTKVELEQKALNLENSKVNYTNAKISYEDLKRQLKLASEQSKNNVKIANSLKDDLIVRSQFDGIVYKISGKIGEMVNTTTPIAVIGQKNFIIELNIDEFDIVKIAIGQKVIIRMDSYQSEVFEATISNVYPMMNDRTRSFQVEAVFTSSPKVLYPNLTLEANIIVKEKQNALTIPTSCIIGDSSVMLENGIMQRVQIGLKDFDRTEILEGVTKGNKIKVPTK